MDGVDLEEEGEEVQESEVWDVVDLFGNSTVSMDSKSVFYLFSPDLEGIFFEIVTSRPHRVVF